MVWDVDSKWKFRLQGLWTSCGFRILEVGITSHCMEGFCSSLFTLRSSVTSVQRSKLALYRSFDLVLAG